MFFDSFLPRVRKEWRLKGVESPLEKTCFKFDDQRDPRVKQEIWFYFKIFRKKKLIILN